MGHDEKKYRHIFLGTLDPFLDFLQAQRQEMTVGNWLEIVRRTQIRITVNPEQYLGRDLPPSDVIEKIINEIFDQLVIESVREPIDIVLP